MLVSLEYNYCNSRAKCTSLKNASFSKSLTENCSVKCIVIVIVPLAVL